MTSAGRILIMPKGNYDSSVTYEMLDLVFYNGASYIAKKTVVGIEPSAEQSEYWQLLCASTDLGDILTRLSALENKGNVDLSVYALKTSLDATNTNVANLTATVLDVQNIANTNTANVKNVSNSVTNLANQINSLPMAANTEIQTYIGNGTNGINNPCSVTFKTIVPKAIMVIGWKQSNNNYQTNMQSGAYRYNVSFILCDELSTSYLMGAGFLFCDSTNQPSRYAKKSADGKTIYWYIEGDGQSQAQINQSGYKYYILGMA